MTPGSEPSVAVVVLNWNGPETTAACIESLDRVSYANKSLVVVDNGSTDSSVATLRDRYPALRIVETGRNLGYAGGMNAALRPLGPDSPDYVWLLNNDAQPAPGALTALVDLAERRARPRRGRLGPRVGRTGTGRAGLGRRTRQLLVGTGEPPSARRFRTTRSTTSSGQASACAGEALQALGFFDERFFLYWEDTDLSFRLRAAGWRLGVAAGSIVRHRWNTSLELASPGWDREFTASSVAVLQAPRPRPVAADPRQRGRTAGTPARCSGQAGERRGGLAGAASRAGDVSAPTSHARPPSPRSPTAPVALVFDPANFTPFYDLSLVGALEAEGWDVELVTSEYEFEDVTRSDRVPRAARLADAAGPPDPARPAQAGDEDALLPRRHRSLRPATRGDSVPRSSTCSGRSSPGSTARCGRAGAGGAGGRLHGPRRASPPGNDSAAAGTSYPRLVRGADAVVVHSEYARTSVIDVGASPERVHVVPPASPVAPERLRPHRAQARVELGLAPDDPIVLFFGFVKPYKGLAVLLESFPVAEARGAGGTAPDRRRGDGAPARLRATDRPTSRSRPPSTGARASCRASRSAPTSPPPTSSPCPTSRPRRAACSSRPTRAHVPSSQPPSAGLRELVVPGVTGLVVPPADPAALAGALAELLRDPERAERMAERGRELVEAQFAWPAVARRLDAVYRDLLA